MIETGDKLYCHTTLVTNNRGLTFHKGIIYGVSGHSETSTLEGEKFIEIMSNNVMALFTESEIPKNFHTIEELREKKLEHLLY